MAHSSNINQIIIEIERDMLNSSNKTCTIPKVTKGLSDSNPNAYKPQLISFGPYHRNNPQLHSMENYKLRYLERFCKRKAEINVKKCIKELETLKDRALKCYDDIKDHNNGEFLRMLLLDGCFIVEFIRERGSSNGEKNIIEVGCIYNQVVQDMLLLENQLPFFVLQKLDHITTMDNETSFTTLTRDTFKSLLPKMHPSFKIESNNTDIKHLLQLVHMSYQPSKKQPSQTEENLHQKIKYSWKSLFRNPFQRIRLKTRISDQDKDCNQETTSNTIMPNATELYEAGVRFMKVEEEEEEEEEEDNNNNDDHEHNHHTCLFDIKFEKGLFRIPHFEVFDSTETIMRNLIAYEQQSFDVETKYFSDFFIFMDYLINSDKDVIVLRHTGIIKNQIGGDDKEVTSFFNKIGKGISLSHNFYYKEVCRKAIEHRGKRWNRMKASLMHNYFYSPWAGASTVGAIILLILTTIQTILAFRGR